MKTFLNLATCAHHCESTHNILPSARFNSMFAHECGKYRAIFVCRFFPCERGSRVGIAFGSFCLRICDTANVKVLGTFTETSLASACYHFYRSVHVISTLLAMVYISVDYCFWIRQFIVGLLCSIYFILFLPAVWLSTLPMLQIMTYFAIFFKGWQVR